MKRLYISESERREILSKHKSKTILFEQSTTLIDLQKLVGVNPDGQLGPITLSAIEKAIGGGTAPAAGGTTAAGGIPTAPKTDTLTAKDNVVQTGDNTSKGTEIQANQGTDSSGL